MKKVTKTERNNYLAYYGWTIPIFLIVFWVTFFFIFQNIYAVKKYQKLVIFYAAYNLKDKTIHKKMKASLKEYGCLDVEYYSYAFDDPQIVENYNALKKNCDFFVISEYDLKEMKEEINNQYMPLTNELIEKVKAPESYQYYSYGSVSYGFKVFDKDNVAYNQMTHFNEWVNFTKEEKTDNFYLVINKDSVNFNEEKGHTLGYHGLEWLLNLGSN